MAKNIKQKAKFDIGAKELYQALLNSRSHSEMTGGKAKVSNKVGGVFTAHGGFISGTNIELVSGKRIVQVWRGSDWDAGEFSIVRMDFKSIGRNKTEITLTQTGVPDKNAQTIRSGWKNFYWNPIRSWIAENT